MSDLATEYFQVGITRQHDTGAAVVFGTGTLGAVNFAPSDKTIGSELLMAFSFGGGFKYFFSDQIGIRIHGRMLLPIQWGSVGLFCGTGGCGTSTQLSSTIIQGDVGGGIVFKLY